MSKSLEPKEIAEIAAKALDGKKAGDIKAVYVSKLTIVADYFIIASASSGTQAKALADEVELKLSERGLKPPGVEGYSKSDWLVLDYGSVVVHIFYGESREFYSLEKLWADGESVDLLAQN
ncbi:MAG: ribosome silencing factor [Oscillospiraceae bacterium]|jgi:ribosome-associated protein|nr:ribosome silencing factor [Oscillospiraceae bacterium]